MLGFGKKRKSLSSLEALINARNAGYDIREGNPSFKQRIFGGSNYVVTPRKDYVPKQELENKKTSLDIQKLNQELEDAKTSREMIMGNSSGSNPLGAYQSKTLKFGGQEFQNANYKEPLNELQTAILAKKQKEKSDAEQAQSGKDELLRQGAEENLNAIGEAKKGIKYFGAMGNVPTIVAPSTILSGGAEYAPRKNWETNINKVLSQKVIDVMTAMKQASKTGATGFGQLSNKELGVLQEASTALKRDLAPQDAEKYLNEMEKIHRRVLSGGGRFGQGAQAAGDEIDVIAPDGTVGTIPAEDLEEALSQGYERA